jgi:hypothetical protein
MILIVVPLKIVVTYRRFMILISMILGYTRVNWNTIIYVKKVWRLGNVGNGKKYAHLNADHMLEFANNVTITAQSTASILPKIAQKS